MVLPVMKYDKPQLLKTYCKNISFLLPWRVATSGSFKNYYILVVRTTFTYLATITNYYRRQGFEFDCNQEAPLVRGAKPLIDFN